MVFIRIFGKMSNYNLHLSTYPVLAITLNYNKLEHNRALISYLLLSIHSKGRQQLQTSSPVAAGAVLQSFQPHQHESNLKLTGIKGQAPGSPQLLYLLQEGNKQIAPSTTTEVYAF